jgi:hypothetical protein
MNTLRKSSQNSPVHHAVALFTSLPFDILEQIMAYLSLGSHATLYQTCHTFRSYYMRVYHDQEIDFFMAACLSLGYNVPVTHPRGKGNTQKYDGASKYVYLACSLASHARKCGMAACRAVFEDEKIRELSSLFSCYLPTHGRQITQRFILRA